jgi:hypothetical protein
MSDHRTRSGLHLPNPPMGRRTLLRRSGLLAGGVALAGPMAGLLAACGGDDGDTAASAGDDGTNIDTLKVAGVDVSSADLFTDEILSSM